MEGDDDVRRASRGSLEVRSAEPRAGNGSPRAPAAMASAFNEDKITCPFYFKIGACRHGDACSRVHHKPTASETVLLKNMYQKPLAASGDGSVIEMDEQELQRDFENFYEETFAELSSFGTLEMLYVCDNNADHLVGNVYARFKSQEDAEKAVRGLNGRFFAGRALVAELSPVTDFRDASCRMFAESICNRGGMCNFIHMKRIDAKLSRKLYGPPAKLP